MNWDTPAKSGLKQGGGTERNVSAEKEREVFTRQVAYQYPVWLASSESMPASVLAFAMTAQSMTMYFLQVERIKRGP